MRNVSESGRAVVPMASRAPGPLGSVLPAGASAMVMP